MTEPVARRSRPAKVAYAIGSLAVTWLAASFVIGAAPASHTMAQVYPFFGDFLHTFDLQHDWGFFSPDPGTGHVVRYEVRDGTGAVQSFRLTEELDRWAPAYFRFTTMYTKASKPDGDYMAGAVHYLCRRHADIGARRVRIVVAHQQKVSPEEYLEGTGTMDQLEVYARPWHDCEETES